MNRRPVPSLFVALLSSAVTAAPVRAQGAPNPDPTAADPIAADPIAAALAANERCEAGTTCHDYLTRWASASAELGSCLDGRDSAVAAAAAAARCAPGTECAAAVAEAEELRKKVASLGRTVRALRKRLAARR